jgi:hypothetical protein
VPRVIVLDDRYDPPNHCHNCGKAFPWAKAKLEAAKEHVLEVEGLEESEKLQLQNALSDLAAGGPRTELAVSRFKRLMKKAGQSVGSGLYKVAIDLGCGLNRSNRAERLGETSRRGSCGRFCRNGWR